MYSWVGLEKEIRGFSKFTINGTSMMNALKRPVQNGFCLRGLSVTALSSQASQEERCWQSAAMLQNLFWQWISGAGNSSTSAKQEDGAGAALFRASIGIFMHTRNCSFDRCPQAHKKTKKVEKKENSLHQKLFTWQSLASRTGNLGQGIEDEAMRGEGVQ